MRKFRFFLLALVVLAVAQPMFACLECNELGRCQWTPYTTPKCKFLESGGCEDGQNVCWGSQRSISDEWEVASVEIQRPNEAVAAIDHDDDAQPVVAVNKHESKR